MFEKILKYLYFNIECKDELPYLDNARVTFVCKARVIGGKI